jgi:hypothetical protein
MHPDDVYEPARFTDLRYTRDRPLPFDQAPHEVSFQLTRRAALTVLLGLSLGLWAAIWAALASLASAALG